MLAGIIWIPVFIGMTRASIYIPSGGTDVFACALSQKLACLSKKGEPALHGKGRLSKVRKLISIQIKGVFV